MDANILFYILILSPLVGFLINGFRVKSHSPVVAGSIATGAVVVSFAAACLLFLKLVNLPEDARNLSISFFDWIYVGDLKLNMGFYLDQLNGVMILIITGIGSLIHLFSISYMHHDEGATKYFSYLNLFLFNMLILVLGDSLPVMFVGWEGVGLCSYLLIGFWFKDSQKAAAGMKAFITNRIGDAAFIIGMFILFVTFGTLNFQELNKLMPATAEVLWLGPITLATLFLFIGATGKSAQIPLYVWLPDAMAGPTPVSALIHAATMVTAGVYMICRLNGVFLAAPNTMLVIAIIGGATALSAALIGMTQFDIKKILAYSTVSQLGYMFLACGVGAFGAAMFHLMTHAFFKALMFLGSGSVIHSMHEEQDVRKMGGLRKYMPVTHLTFFLGWLAILGIPPFAGFFSKDEILWLSFHSPLGHWSLWLVGLIGAVITSFYMTRLMALTFWGKSRISKDVHPHESPALMTVPLVILGLLSVVGGWIGIPHVLGGYLGHVPNVLEHWYSKVVLPIPGIQPAVHSTELLLMGLSVLLVTISAATAYYMYVVRTELPGKIVNKIKPVHNFINNKFFVDEFYFGFIIDPIVKLSKNLWFYFDVNFIDKTTYVLSDLVKGSGQLVRSIQNGNIQQYALYISIGLSVTLTFILMRS